MEDDFSFWDTAYFLGLFLVLGSRTFPKINKYSYETPYDGLENMDRPQTYHILIVFLVVPKLTRMYIKNAGLEHVSSRLPKMATYGTQLCKTHALM